LRLGTANNTSEDGARTGAAVACDVRLRGSAWGGLACVGDVSAGWLDACARALYRIPPPLDVIAIALDAFGKETAALGHEGLPRERSVEIAAQTLAIDFARDELNRLSRLHHLASPNCRCRITPPIREK
jgi:hypothetical protein